MVDATAKNTVDTFNGMKKATLKEGIKNLIKRALMENEEDVYEMQGPKEDSYYKSELSDYLDDNGIFGYTDMIHDIMTGPDEEENSASLADFLDDHQIYGYNKGIEGIFADYPYDQHWMNQPDEEEDDMSHPRGYEEASDEESFDDLFEATDTEADKNMVRKLMAMYETEPSKFERVHKQAQVQADTTKDIKAKHLVSLFDRAKAGALQSLANQDRFEADREGMDENADKFYAPTYITQKYGAAKAKEIEANIEDEGANTWDLFTSLETPKEVDDFIGGFTMDESISLKDLL
jgi:hypothetical protein